MSRVLRNARTLWRRVDDAVALPSRPSTLHLLLWCVLFSVAVSFITGLLFQNPISLLFLAIPLGFWSWRGETRAGRNR